MNTVSASIKSKEQASRKELLVRFVYAIPLAIVLMVLSVIAGVCTIVQWFHILAFKKRNMMLNEWIVKYLEYDFKVNTYTNLATDERPEIMPE
ncbi:DUF4389 domain-containing protein [Candidatus Micrarchaeota archaeon]|nr:DUF4389 domain-containing protein [Candidatus Micrarchaeota archaeon]